MATYAMTRKTHCCWIKLLIIAKAVQNQLIPNYIPTKVDPNGKLIFHAKKNIVAEGLTKMIRTPDS